MHSFLMDMISLDSHVTGENPEKAIFKGDINET